MMVPSLGGKSAVNNMYNAAFNRMNAANSLMNLCSFYGLQNQNLDAIHAADQRLTSDMYNNSLMYKMSEAQLEALKKSENENIKRSFSTFA